jgi:Flp pilus assembly protein TadD
VLAAVKVDYDWDWQGAEYEYRRALSLNPGYPTAHHWYGLHLSRMGRFAEAETEMKRALELDPLSLIINTDAADVFYCARKPQDAFARLQTVLEMDPNFAEAHLVLGKVYEQTHEFSKAMAEFQLSSELFHYSPNAEVIRAHGFALSGKPAEARKILARLQQSSSQRYVSNADLAVIACGLGDTAGAMRLLNKGYNQRDKGMNILASDPLFDTCRSDSHFQDMIHRLKLRPSPRL